MLQAAGRSADIEAVQSATQSGSGAYVLNYNTGQITHIDGATLTAGTPQPASSRQDPRLAIATTLKATWILSSRGTLAQEVDPARLASLGGDVQVQSARHR